jgi:hypothetical protein
MRKITTLKHALLRGLLLCCAFSISACNSGGGSDNAPPNAGQTGSSTQPTVTANTTADPASANGDTATSSTSNLAMNQLTAANHWDALRAVMELTFRRPMFFANGGVGHQFVFPHHFDYRTFGTIRPCPFGGKRTWTFNDENKNLALNGGETGLMTYSGCMQGQAGELQTNGTILQTITEVYGKYTQDWNLTKDVPGRQLKFKGIITAEHVFKGDITFATGHEKINNFEVEENGKPYIKALMIDIKLWPDISTPSSLQYFTAGGFELRGRTLHFSLMLTEDITGNFGDFSIGIEDPQNHSAVRYNPSNKGEVVANFYAMGDVKPSSTSTLKWTDILPGGY